MISRAVSTARCLRPVFTTGPYATLARRLLRHDQSCVAPTQKLRAYTQVLTNKHSSAEARLNEQIVLQTLDRKRCRFAVVEASTDPERHVRRKHLPSTPPATIPARCLTRPKLLIERCLVHRALPFCSITGESAGARPIATATEAAIPKQQQQQPQQPHIAVGASRHRQRRSCA